MSAADHGSDSSETDQKRPPLKVIRARSADPVEEYPPIGAVKYTVYLELSRKASQYECAVAGRLESMRLYGETLEIRQTTLEEVAAGKSKFIAIVRDVETKGRVLELAAMRREEAEKNPEPDPEQVSRWRRHNSQAAIRDAERERRKTLAEQISFE
jgi:hypothetical protein